MTKISLHRFESSTDSDPRFTLRDEANGQLMHSNIGPRDEADALYATPGLAHLRKSFPKGAGEAVAWDVASGTGSNAAALLDAWKRSDAGAGPARLLIVSFELHRETMEATLANLGSFPHLTHHRGRLESLLRDGFVKGAVGERAYRWELRLGDFRDRFADAPAADLIFYDFYSPRAVPEFWRAPILERIHRAVSSRPALLLTYVSATWVRLHLSAAGFFLGEGARTSQKDQTTAASVDPSSLEKPFPKEWAARIDRSVHAESTDAIRERARAHPQWRD